MKPLVSVIIPVYNKENVIEFTLNSILLQTYSNIEIIIINDGSTDGSLDILKKYLMTYSHKIKLIESHNQGGSNARNLGIKASQGEFIQFLDADDLLSSDKIEKQLHLLQKKSKYNVCVCQWVMFQHDPSEFLNLPYGAFNSFHHGIDLLLQLWNNQEMMQPASYLIHRSLLEKAGMWDESLIINQDGEFFARVLMQAEGVLYEPKGKVYYRRPGETNVSQQKSEMAIKSLLESYRCYEKEILKVEDSLRVRIALKKNYQKFIYDVFPAYPDLVRKAEIHINSLGILPQTYIGGPKFQLISKVLGFKKALKIKRMLS